MREWLIKLTDIAKCSDKPVTRSGIQWWIDGSTLYLTDLQNDTCTTIQLNSNELKFLNDVLCECNLRTLDLIIEKLNTPLNASN